MLAIDRFGETVGFRLRQDFERTAGWLGARQQEQRPTDHIYQMSMYLPNKTSRLGKIRVSNWGGRGRGRGGGFTIQNICPSRRGLCTYLHYIYS